MPNQKKGSATPILFFLFGGVLVIEKRDCIELRLLANRHIESDTHAGLNALRPCMDDRIYI